MADQLRTAYTLRMKDGANIHRSECPDALSGQRAGLTAAEATLLMGKGARVHECVDVNELAPHQP